MKERQRGRRKWILPSAVIFLLLIAALGGMIIWFCQRIYRIPDDALRKEDLAALEQEDYEGVFLSMFLSDRFDGGAFEYYRGVPVVQAEHTFVNLADIGDYLDHCFSTKEEMKTVYIGLDPYEISKLYGHHASLYARDYLKTLLDQASRHPETVFEVLFPFRSLEELRSFPENKYTELVTAYRNFVNMCIPYDNIIIYYAGFEEWLITNPGNYDETGECTAEIAQVLMAKTFQNDNYVLTTANMEDRFEKMTELVQETPADWPDLSQWCLVFFGDSILEYNAGSRSVPGVVAGLSGAQVYNCGQGGTPAVGAFQQMVSHFLEQDISGLDGWDNYLQGLTEFLQEDHEGKKYCFVINFGLNDYFDGCLVDNSQDPYDIGTYAGALRAGIRDLLKAYPNAQILVLAPTYTSSFSGGKEKMSKQGGVLTDYVDAALLAAKDMGVLSFNSYTSSGIRADNEGQFLADGCHPKEQGALLLGKCILEELRKVADNDK